MPLLMIALCATALPALLLRLNRLCRRVSTAAVAAPHSRRFAMETLGDRTHIDNFVLSSTLNYAWFAPDSNGGFDLTANPFATTTSNGIFFQSPTISDPTTDSTYSTYRLRITGSFDIDTDGLYYFRLPSVDGAILTVDGQNVVFAPAYPGDATLNGLFNDDDLAQLSGFGSYNDGRTDHTWNEGDFTGDGRVDDNDLLYMDAFGKYNFAAAPTAQAFDNVTLDYSPYGGPTIGIHLSAGTHSFALDTFHFNGDPNSAALMQWARDNTTSFANVNSSSAPVLTPSLLSAGQGQSFSGPLATFTPAGADTQAGHYTASVDWGDGSTSSTADATNPLTIQLNSNGTFSLAGSHTYATAGAVTPTIGLTHTPSGATVSASGAVTVAPSVATANLVPMHLTEGVWFHGTIATITTSNLLAQTSDFSPTMDWGPGGGESGDITVVGASGFFQVVGSHVYHADRLEPVTLTVNDAADGRQLDVSSVLNVASSSMDLTPAQGLQSLRDDKPPHIWTAVAGAANDLATFTDSDPQSIDPWSGTVRWADGEIDELSIARPTDGGNVFAVSGGRLKQFDDEGKQLFQLTILHGRTTVVATGSLFAHERAASGDSRLFQLSADEGTGTEQTPPRWTLTDAVLANFNVNEYDPTPEGYEATIHWGDGSTSAGTLVRVGSDEVPPSLSSFDVHGTHVYTHTLAIPGMWVELRHDGTRIGVAGQGMYLYGDPADTGGVGHLPTSAGGASDPQPDQPDPEHTTPPGTAPDPVAGDSNGNGDGDGDGNPGGDQPDPQPQDGITISGQTIEGAEGGYLPSGQLLATFADTQGDIGPGGYNVSVTYDGQDVPVYVLQGADDQTFNVYSDDSAVTLGEEGWQPLTIDVTQADRSASATAWLQIDHAPLHVTGPNGGVRATAGQSWFGAVATFTDEGLPGTAADYTATVDWGDGTAPSSTSDAQNPPTIESDGNGGYNVMGTHTFAAGGPNGEHPILTVTASEKSPGTAADTGQVVADLYTNPITPHASLHWDGLSPSDSQYVGITLPAGASTELHIAASTEDADNPPDGAAANLPPGTTATLQLVDGFDQVLVYDPSGTQILGYGMAGTGGLLHTWTKPSSGGDDFLPPSVTVEAAHSTLKAFQLTLTVKLPNSGGTDGDDNEKGSSTAYAIGQVDEDRPELHIDTDFNGKVEPSKDDSHKQDRGGIVVANKDGVYDDPEQPATRKELTITEGTLKGADNIQLQRSSDHLKVFDAKKGGNEIAFTNNLSAVLPAAKWQNKSLWVQGGDTPSVTQADQTLSLVAGNQTIDSVNFTVLWINVEGRTYNTQPIDGSEPVNGVDSFAATSKVPISNVDRTRQLGVVADRPDAGGDPNIARSNVELIGAFSVKQLNLGKDSPAGFKSF